MPTSVRGVYEWVPGYNSPTYGMDYANYGSFEYNKTANYAYPFKVFHDDYVIEYWGENKLIEDKLFDNINKNLRQENLDKYLWKQLHQSIKQTLKGIANPATNVNSDYIIDDKNINATYLFKKSSFGKIYAIKTYTNFKYNDSEITKTFDWGIGIALTLKTPFKIWKTRSGEPDALIQPKKFRIKIYGAAKTNGSWHGSFMEF